MRAVAAVTLLASASGVSAQLNALAKAAGLQYFGTELDPNDQSDQTYWRIGQNSSNFGQMTCDNSMKWDTIEPQQGQFNYGTADQQVAQALAAGQVIRCHNLNWYSQLPSWVSNGNWNAQSMTSVIQSHIANEAGHFKGKCLHWDVVNEALNDVSIIHRSLSSCLRDATGGLTLLLPGWHIQE
jgi:endo-1,4-beta-xylanase